MEEKGRVGGEGGEEKTSEESKESEVLGEDGALEELGEGECVEADREAWVMG